MRKLLLLPVLFFLILTSCKEDDGDPAPSNTVNDQIKGTWVTTNQSYKYYDASGQEVYEERDDTNTVFSFDGSKVTSTYDTGGGMSGTYTITQNDGKSFINLTEDSQTKQMEILSIGSSAMIWTSEEDNAQYFDNGLKTADHAVITIDFKK
ncbi:hypothetical protein [Pontibacter pamirensis]|uniref:hypothetical protein n=1 Tax=Pontibacter pamirensis TaxID=2562824 RepID=UPI00138A13DE|nr:hypothetical protein [Pontibacter pamirensis]